MFDREIALDALHKIRSVIDTIIERTSLVKNPDEFLCSPNGMLCLDAICMNLIAMGEAVKGLDKLTPWRALAQVSGSLLEWSDAYARQDSPSLF